MSSHKKDLLFPHIFFSFHLSEHSKQKVVHDGTKKEGKEPKNSLQTLIVKQEQERRKRKVEGLMSTATIEDDRQERKTIPTSTTTTTTTTTTTKWIWIKKIVTVMLRITTR